MFCNAAETRPTSALTKNHILPGTIYDQVIELADKLDIELILIGAHGPAIKDYLLGSNAAHRAAFEKVSPCDPKLKRAPANIRAIKAFRPINLGDHAVGPFARLAQICATCGNI